MSRYLNFTLGQEHYAIPLLQVREVIAVPEITRLPLAAPHLLGLMNLRGQVISVMDLCLKLNIKSSSQHERVVMICDIAPLCVGLIVDSINSVVSFRPEDIGDRPEMNETRASHYISGVARQDKQLIVILDLAKALDVVDRTFASRPNEKLAA